MTEEQFIDALCDACTVEDDKRAGIHDRHIYYVDGANLGSHLARCVFEGRNEPWMRRGFAVIERALVEGTAETTNLVVVGLFEAMQNHAYRSADPPDCLDTWLGPRSRAAWANLIEGWTGDGVRSVETWRRVVINGSRSAIELEMPGFAFRAQLDQPRLVEWQHDDATGVWTPTAEDTVRITAPVRPLLAVRRGGPADIGTEHATLVVTGGQGDTRIRFGALVDGGRLARTNTEVFVIDLDALSASWLWIVAATPDRA